MPKNTAGPDPGTCLPKSFSSFSRPRLASTTLIIHGFSVTTALTPHICSTNSSRTCELIALGLTDLSKKLTKAFLTVQADNCVEEVKNNSVLRLMAMWISLGKLAGGELSFLSSGHSHEDIDALFSLLRGWIEAHKEIWSPHAFQQCIQFNPSMMIPDNVLMNLPGKWCHWPGFVIGTLDFP